ncbi:Di-sulfide bridge nucleocytoplasmic transport domain-containing protein [Cladorrhinum sp. PSN332]|nr:Di-sulfide bridge nucleocytoplasmic transport domain-containing protein [Cladorrhinum sp. PSN332]
MERRGMEGHMDWEYQNQPTVDPTSPFVNLPQKLPLSSFNSPANKFSRVSTDPFANAARRSSPLKPREDQPKPPHSSFFTPQVNRPLAPAFRNPAFNTPQKRFDGPVLSEFSDVESSPAFTDETSIMPAETPDVDRYQDSPTKLAFTPSPTKSLFGKTLLRNHHQASGKGDLLRSGRDKIRKRKRLTNDRDVGSVRPRLPHDSDDSDSDYEAALAQQLTQESKAVKSSRRGKEETTGVIGGFLSTVSNHPSAPAILSRWLQFGINLMVVSFVLYAVFSVYAQIRYDLHHANEQARNELINRMNVCSEHFRRNGCAPKANRPPALDAPCNEWEMCMNQDANAIKKMQVSVRNVAEILNEFVGVLTLKAWGFLFSLFAMVLIAGNVGFGASRHELPPAMPAKPAEPVQPPPVVPPMLGHSIHHNPSQAYIWAPIGHTPRSVRKTLFADEATDTDNSPDYKMIMPPQTPSGRRSPSKGDRDRSPSKGVRARSPSKGY